MAKKHKPISHAAEDRAEDEADDDILEELPPVAESVPEFKVEPVPPGIGYPRWVYGGGVMEGGEQDGETLKDLLLLVESADEEQAVKAGTAPLTHVKTASEDVLGIVVKR